MLFYWSSVSEGMVQLVNVEGVAIHCVFEEHFEYADDQGRNYSTDRMTIFDLLALGEESECIFVWIRERDYLLKGGTGARKIQQMSFLLSIGLNQLQI